MAIPDFQSFLRPVLACLADGQPKTMAQIREWIQREMHFTDADLAEMLPSGQMTVFVSRVGWAKTYLVKAGLVETVTRGTQKITAPGITFLKEHSTFRVKDLLKIDEFKKFHTSKPGTNGEINNILPDNDSIILAEKTPDDIIQNAWLTLKNSVTSELLETLKKIDPTRFEHIVVELLVKMGYGGSFIDAAQVIGKSGDGGLDGVIKEDKLGLDVIYVQAKRWEGTIGRPELQKFVGALEGAGASKGIFITTSNFSKEARDYTPRNSKIVRIDGERLTELMFEHGLGVTTRQTLEIKRIDSDYFEE